MQKLIVDYYYFDFSKTKIQLYFLRTVHLRSAQYITVKSRGISAMIVSSELSKIAPYISTTIYRGLSQVKGIQIKQKNKQKMNK